ncbi:hypothetical protein ACFWW0_19455, partial [Streptomyces violascens]
MSAAAALALAGCTTSAAPQHGASPRTMKAPAYGTEDIGRRPPQNLRQGGTLTLATSQWITQYNVNQAAGTIGEASEIDSLVEPKLFRGAPHRRPPPPPGPPPPPPTAGHRPRAPPT